MRKYEPKIKVIFDPIRRAERRMHNEHIRSVSKKLEEKQRQRNLATQKAFVDTQLKIPADVELSSEYVQDVTKQVRNNDLISDYYRELYEQSNAYIVDNNGTFEKTNYYSEFLVKSQNVRNCGKNWFFDHYAMQQVYDLKNVYHCKDKFCLHCQKLLQATRLQKFSPIIKELLEQGKHVYHVVLTIPNTTVFTKSLVKFLFRNFKRLTRYFTADAKNRLDLSKYGFIGAIRSFEVTYDDVSYHPHVHCLFVFENPLPDDACIVNDYSYKKDKLTGKRVLYRMFTPFEVLIQKVWRFLYDGLKVTPENVDKLKIGYSCTVDKVDDGNYYEVFKYTVKLQKTDDDAPVMTFENFKTLYYALQNVHIFQGYGIFHGIKCDEIDESLSERYNLLIAQLRLIEEPLETNIPLDDLAMKMLTHPEIRFISRKTVYAFLREHPDFLKQENNP